MARTCTRGIYRSLLFLLGFLFLATSIFLIGGSIYVLVSYHHFSAFLQSKYITVPVGILFLVAIFFAVAGILGFCATCKDNRCVFFSFGFILFLLIVLLIGVSITGAVYRKKIDHALESNTHDLLDKYNGTTDDSITSQVDYAQKALKCCGVNNYTDWFDTPWGLHHVNFVPKSCCKAGVKNCTGAVDATLYFGLDGSLADKNGVATTHGVYEQGCYDKLKDVFTKNLKFVAIAAVILLLFLIFGMIAACSLMCYKRENADVAYFHFRDE